MSRLPWAAINSNAKLILRIPWQLITVMVSVFSQKKKTVMVSVCDGFQLPERTRFLNVELSKP